MSRPLTERQRRFVEAYLRTRNATQAARDAGYSAVRAPETGSEQLQNRASSPRCAPAGSIRRAASIRARNFATRASIVLMPG